MRNLYASAIVEWTDSGTYIPYALAFVTEDGHSAYCEFTDYINANPKIAPNVLSYKNEIESSIKVTNDSIHYNIFGSPEHCYSEMRAFFEEIVCDDVRFIVDGIDQIIPIHLITAIGIKPNCKIDRNAIDINHLVKVYSQDIEEFSWLPRDLVVGHFLPHTQTAISKANNIGLVFESLKVGNVYRACVDSFLKKFAVVANDMYVEKSEDNKGYTYKREIVDPLFFEEIRFAFKDSKTAKQISELCYIVKVDGIYSSTAIELVNAILKVMNEDFGEFNTSHSDLRGFNFKNKDHKPLHIIYDQKI